MVDGSLCRLTIHRQTPAKIVISGALATVIEPATGVLGALLGLKQYAGKGPCDQVHLVADPIGPARSHTNREASLLSGGNSSPHNMHCCVWLRYGETNFARKLSARGDHLFFPGNKMCGVSLCLERMTGRPPFPRESSRSIRRPRRPSAARWLGSVLFRLDFESSLAHRSAHAPWHRSDVDHWGQMDAIDSHIRTPTQLRPLLRRLQRHLRIHAGSGLIVEEQKAICPRSRARPLDIEMGRASNAQRA